MAVFHYGPHNPNITKGWEVREVIVDGNPEGWRVWVPHETPCNCGCEHCKHVDVEMRPHTSGTVFDEIEDAEDWIEGLQESYDESFDRHCEENRYEIMQAERYEMWRNEY